MTPEALAALAMALPVAGASVVVAARRWPLLRDGASVLTALATLSAVLAVRARYLAVPETASGSLTLVEVMPGMSLALRVEALGLLFAVVATGLWVPTALYAAGYMRANREPGQTRFAALFALAMAATLGVAFAGNLLALYVFYELLTLVTYPLVTHHGTPEAVRAGRTYVGMLIAPSVLCQLLAIVWIQRLVSRHGPGPGASGLDFIPGGILGPAVAAGTSPVVVALLFVLFVYGTAKAALMPLHGWLPAAMVAPAPVSALLHAVAVVKSGVFVVFKVTLYTFGVATLADLGAARWLIYGAGATIVLASLLALHQKNLKARLAYSTISQLSYVLLGVAVLSPLALAGAAWHMVVHALGKITLFFTAGSLYTVGHRTQVHELAGAGRRMPVTMASFAIGAVSMVGLPPTAGFLSKWYLTGGAWQADELFALVVILASTLLTAGYYAPIVHSAFLAPGPAGAPPEGEAGEAPWPMTLATALTATATLAIFFCPEPVRDLMERLSSVLAGRVGR